MIGPGDLDEYFDLLEKQKQEFENRKSTELEPLLIEQMELIQKLVSTQTKIMAIIAGFKV